MYYAAVICFFLMNPVAGYDGWCPGTIMGHDTGTTDNYCCINSPATTSTSSLSICTDLQCVKTHTISIPKITGTPSCGASIPLIATNYDDLVSSATSKYLQGSDGGPTETGAADGSGNSATTTGAGGKIFPTMMPVCAGVIAYAAMH